MKKTVRKAPGKSYRKGIRPMKKMPNFWAPMCYAPIGIISAALSCGACI